MSDQTIYVRHSAPDLDDGPGTPSLSYLEQAPPVEICRDVYDGTLRLRRRGRKYLPQFPKESDEAYAERLGRAVLFNAFRKTVRALTGMVFRKDPAFSDDVPEAIKPHLENIDLADRHVAIFAADGFQAKLIDGHGYILVDWSGPEGARNAAEEGEARPYWVWIDKLQVIRFRSTQRNGEIVLTSFAYIETDVVEDGEFKEKEIERVRQYDLVEGDRVQYRSWVRDVDSGGTWEPEEAGKLLGPRMTRIPVVADYGDRTGFMKSDPPLLDLAIENLEHYDVRSDRRQSLKTGSVPIFATIGVDGEDVQTFAVGPSIGLALPEGADAKYIEIQGTAFDATRQELQDIEQRMSALGLAVLVRKDRVQRTATESENDRIEQDSDLGAMARATGDALEEALQLHAMWMGLPEGGSVEVNRDFDARPMDAQMVSVLSKMVGEGALSLDTLWDILMQGEILPETFDPEIERDRLQNAGTGEMAAVVEALRRERSARGERESEPEEVAA